MASAREIRAQLRRKEADELRRREDAVVAAYAAAVAAVRTRSDNDTALRETFEAALKSRTDPARAAALRTAFDAALADSPQVVESELAAGRAVLDALAFRVTQTELADLTGQRVEDLRRWSQMAKQAELKASAGTSSARHDGRDDASGQGSPARPTTGFAVVARPAPDGGLADEEGGDVAAAG